MDSLAQAQHVHAASGASSKNRQPDQAGWTEQKDRASMQHDQGKLQQAPCIDSRNTQQD